MFQGNSKAHIEIIGRDGSNNTRVLAIKEFLGSNIEVGGSWHEVSAYIPSDIDDLKFAIVIPQQSNSYIYDQYFYVTDTEIKVYNKTQTTINSKGISIYNSPITHFYLNTTDGFKMKGFGIEVNEIKLAKNSNIGSSYIDTPEEGYATVAVRVVNGVIRLYVKLDDGTTKYVSVNA